VTGSELIEVSREGRVRGRRRTLPESSHRNLGQLVFNPERGIVLARNSRGTPEQPEPTLAMQSCVDALSRFGV